MRVRAGEDEWCWTNDRARLDVWRRRARTRERESNDERLTNDDDAQCVNEADDRSACFKFREDYVECLHHKKEYRRENEIENERQRRNEEHANAKKEALLKEMRTFSWVTDEKYAPKK